MLQRPLERHVGAMDHGVKIRDPKPKGRPQVRRERADALIVKLIEAADAINADPRMMHDVVRLSVFGSYLGDKPVLGDLDVAFEFRGRWKPREYESRSLQFRRDFPMPASTAADFFKRMMWPEKFTLRRLRVGRGISFHDQSDLDACGFERRVFFPVP